MSTGRELSLRQVQPCYEVLDCPGLTPAQCACNILVSFDFVTLGCEKIKTLFIMPDFHDTIILASCWRRGKVVVGNLRTPSPSFAEQQVKLTYVSWIRRMHGWNDPSI